ncbi:MAG: aminotransferase class V-fold PLP-dependent enzyme [Clostridia bacterium]|nr:aminotransferase class V-fold PLP-dependent enzyme [Clostridia bacterium]
MIYFDNSATTLFKPECVKNAVYSTMSCLSANPGRASHSMAIKTASLIYYARKAIADEINLNNPDRIIFTASCTDALNMAILGSMKKGHVITTAYEHNSVLRPLFSKAKEYNTEISVIEPSFNGIDVKDIERILKRDTYMIIVNHVSNVTGQIAPLYEIGKLCKKHGILFIVDGAQSVGYHKIDVMENNIDMLAIAPHKGLHAVTGFGILALSEKVKLKHIKFGGTGTSSAEITQPLTYPEGFEVGTLPTVAISSLIPAIKWCEKNRLQNDKRIFDVSEIIINGLLTMPNVTLYTPRTLRNGIISFNVEGLSSSEACDILSSQYDICTRCGLHCAPLIHKYLGTISGGCIRVSVGCDNTYGEAEYLLDALREISRQ